MEWVSREVYSCSAVVFSSHLGQKALEKQKENKPELDSLGLQLQLDNEES